MHQRLAGQRINHVNLRREFFYATLTCDGEGGVGKVTFTVGSVRYAENGLAKGSAGTADITPIWTDSPTIAGAKRDITPLIDEGLLLCR